MFNIINSLPLWFRIAVLIVGEIVLIIALIKRKTRGNTYDNSVFILLTILAPFVIVDMVISENPSLLPAGVSDSNLAYIISSVFFLGLVFLMIKKLRSGTANYVEKRLYIFSLIALPILVLIIIIMKITNF